jgi:hypothetical protein
MKYILLTCCLLFGNQLFAQIDSSQATEADYQLPDTQLADDELNKLLEIDEKSTTNYTRNAFKSSRVINGHSMEMIGAGVLDFRILHRFGLLKDGWRNLFGLDMATMRIGFDYGITKNLSAGIGRSTFNKEVDGFIKWRLAHQKTGHTSFPISVILVSGMTMQGIVVDASVPDYFSNRLGYYHQIILGRKFSKAFTLQISPTVVHRNIVARSIESNDIVALGIGSRVKLTNRTAIVVDAHPILYGSTDGYPKMPLSIGVDIETGGHVFQLHVSNSRGMNEKAFIAETMQSWGKGEIQFGFNLSRVFTVKSNKEASN